MKRLNLIFSACVLLSIAGSCAKEFNAPVSGNGLVRFTAGFDATKTALDGTKVVWQNGDAISIFDGTTNVKSVTASSGETALFEASLSQSAPWLALYPYDKSATISSGVITSTVPDSQIAVNGSFAGDVNLAVAESNDGTLLFKNVLSYLKFTVGQDNIFSVTLTGLADETLAGKVAINYNSGSPLWTPVTARKAIVLNAPQKSMTFVKGETYYIGVLPQAFPSGIKLEFTDASGESYAIEHGSSVTLNRSCIYNIGTPDGEIDFDSIIEFEDPDVEADLKKNLNIDTDGDGHISKSECAAVTYDQLNAFACVINNSVASASTLWTDPSKVDTFRELRYFTGLRSSVVYDNMNDYRLPPVFAQCSNLVKVQLPQNLSNCANYCFQGCEKLDSIILGPKVRSVFAYTFAGCKGLKYVKIPNSLASISKCAFQGCESLEKLDFDGDNNSLKSIGDYSFDGCKVMQLSSRNLQQLSSIGNYAFQNCAKIANLTITSSELKKISKYAFAGCTKLATVKVSSSLNELGDYAFSKCPALTTFSNKTATAKSGIELPAAVTVYPQYCFRECGAITKISLPEGVTTIGYRAFAGMKGLTEVVIPSTVTSFAKAAFESSGTNYPVHLTSLTLLATVPPAVTGNAPASGKEPAIDAIYVPAASVDAYKAADYWKTYAAIISAIPAE